MVYSLYIYILFIIIIFLHCRTVRGELSLSCSATGQRRSGIIFDRQWNKWFISWCSLVLYVMLGHKSCSVDQGRLWCKASSCHNGYGRILYVVFCHLAIGKSSADDSSFDANLFREYNIAAFFCYMLWFLFRKETFDSSTLEIKDRIHL